jgi:hypothetical protein
MSAQGLVFDPTSRLILYAFLHAATVGLAKHALTIALEAHARMKVNAADQASRDKVREA